jgi:hypothetical protein
MTDVSLATADLVLVAIGVSLALGIAVSAVSSVSAMLGLAGGSVPASGLLSYALFIDPPSETGE